MAKITTEIRLVTPEWAQQQLDKLDSDQKEGTWKQRTARLRAIHRYAQDMKAGKWLLTHQGIAFDGKNRLIDGQNRLWAVVKSGCSVEMLVSTGLPENGKLTAMDVIDGGSPRTTAQSLQVSHGYHSEAQELAVLSRQLVKMVVSTSGRRDSQGLSPQVSTAETLYIIEELNYLEAFQRFTAIVNLRKLRRGPIVAPWCWYYKAKPRKAEQFARDYATMEGLKKGSPPLALFRYFANMGEVRRARSSEIDKQSITAGCLKAFDEDEPINALQPSPKVALPWLVKLNPEHADKMLKRVL